MNYNFDLDVDKRLIQITVAEAGPEIQEGGKQADVVLDIPFFVWKDVASSILDVEVVAEQLTRGFKEETGELPAEPPKPLIEVPEQPKIQIVR